MENNFIGNFLHDFEISATFLLIFFFSTHYSFYSFLLSHNFSTLTLYQVIVFIELIFLSKSVGVMSRRALDAFYISKYFETEIVMDMQRERYVFPKKKSKIGDGNFNK